MMKNKMGICEWALVGEGPFSIALASDLGFDGIQIKDLGGSGNGYPMNNKRIQMGYLDAALEHRVEIHSLHLMSLVMEGTMKHPLNSAQGESAAKSLKMGVQACADMKIPVLFLASVFNSQIVNNYDFSNFADMLSLACDMGEDKGITIALETVMTIDKILQMRDVVGERLKIMLDTLNPLRYGSGDPVDVISKLGADAIDHVHLKDAPESLMGSSLLGTGSGQYQDSVTAIKKIGYEGWFVLENPHFKQPSCSDMDPLDLIRTDLETMRKSFPG